MKLLAITSAVFCTNFIHNTLKHQYIYAWLFLLLTSSSILVHSRIFEEDLHFHNNLILIDKTIIYCIAVYGGYLYWKCLKQKTLVFPLISISLVIWYYIVGYFSNNYCFDGNKEIAEIYHSMIHIIGCLGHHSIAYNVYNYA